MGFFDLIAPLALKVASIDGDIDDSERDAISSYFVKQWGYDPAFVSVGLEFVEQKLPDFSVKGLALSLAEFKKQNKDCNYKSMSREIVDFLQDIIEADGRIDEREEMAIEKVQAVFDDIARFKFTEMTKKGACAVTGVAKNGFKTATGFARKIAEVNLPYKKD